MGLCRCCCSSPVSNLRGLGSSVGNAPLLGVAASTGDAVGGMRVGDPAEGWSELAESSSDREAGELRASVSCMPHWAAFIPLKVNSALGSEARSWASADACFERGDLRGLLGSGPRPSGLRGRCWELVLPSELAPSEPRASSAWLDGVRLAARDRLRSHQGHGVGG